jgi:hypothetical protein
MKLGTKYWRSSLVVIGIVVALLGSTMAFAHNANPGVFPINSRPYGQTYGQWSARWWQYAFSLTTFDACPAEPSGQVRFLAGTTDGSIADRKCTVPVGKAILFPIINAEWSVVEAQANGDACFVPASPSGTSDKALRACATAQINHVTKLEASVDGVPLQDLTNYRAVSPPFNFTSVPGNPFGVCQPAGCSSHAVADGYWIMLTPLSPGAHTVQFRGEAFFPELNNFTFVTGATYHLTVQAG